MDSTGAKRNPDKITAIGCFLQTHQGKKVFNRDDILSGFESAHESVPKNLSRDIKWDPQKWLGLLINRDKKVFIT